MLLPIFRKNVTRRSFMSRSDESAAHVIRARVDAAREESRRLLLFRHPEPVAHRAAVSKSLSRALPRESRAANLSAA
jgi:2-oxo-4-hydroxy-4-carboxy--5-ureidoimidazoline (OHCU) decarboxylase